MPASSKTPNPKRVAAGRLNRLKSRGITQEGRERLRQAALAARPWEHATGPVTPQGKARSAANGCGRQKGTPSVRATKREVAALRAVLGETSLVRSELTHDPPVPRS